MNLIYNMYLEIKILKLLLYLPATNKLGLVSHWIQSLEYWANTEKPV